MNQKEKAQNKPALGKGLASLLPSAAAQQNPVGSSSSSSATIIQPVATSVVAPGQGAEADATPNKDRHPGISMCLIEEIVPNQYQPRHQFDDATIEELAQSIKENGLIQPLIVRRAQKGYQLIAGERRWRAAKQAGLKQVPIVIRRTTDKEALELALIENIQREDLNCLDTALAYQQLCQEFDLKQEEVATRVGKERASVANYMRLLKLPTKVQNWLKQNTLSFGHGKALLGLENAKDIEEFATLTVDRSWSVRELEAQIQKYKAQSLEANNINEVNQKLSPLELRLKNLGRDLSQKLSTKAQVKGNEKKGKIVLEYFTPEDLDRLLIVLLK